MQHPKTINNVLCISGHDPSGGAGIHADIQSVTANGAHALCVMSVNTAQDTHNVVRVAPVPPILMDLQIETLINDCQIGAVKIGLLGDVEQIPVIVAAIRRLNVAVVLDPVVRAGGGASLTGSALQQAIVESLLPLCTIITPNAAELRILSKTEDEAEGAQRLLSGGCGAVLVTGGDEHTEQVINRLYIAGQSPETFIWPRIPQRFHGAGCTMTAALAARLALGESVRDAAFNAQQYAHQALSNAIAVGKGRLIPKR